MLASLLPMHIQQPVRTDPAPQLKLLTLGWLGAWQLKANGTHAQALVALPPLGGSGGGSSVRLPGRRPSSHACFTDAMRDPAEGGKARRVRLRRAAEAGRHIPLSAGLCGGLMACQMTGGCDAAACRLPARRGEQGPHAGPTPGHEEARRPFARIDTLSCIGSKGVQGAEAGLNFEEGLLVIGACGEGLLPCSDRKQACRFGPQLQAASAAASAAAAAAAAASAPRAATPCKRL